MKTRQVCKHLVPGARLSLHASSCTRSVVCTGAHGEETHGEAASSIERTHLIHSFRKKKEKEKKKIRSVPVPPLLFLAAETHTNDRAI